MKRTLLLIITILLPIHLFGQGVNIGDILCTDGSTVSPAAFASSGKTAEGIVFYVNGTENSGWAVSLECQAVNTDWVTETHYSDMYDIPGLDNYEYSREAMYDLDGYNNTAIIRNAHGADWYPAAWCVDFEHGWYLPSAGQMRWLIAYINEINTSLAVVNGTMFVYNHPRWYWTSTERTGAHAVVLSQTGSVGNYPKWNYIGNYEIGVRAVKTFSLQPQIHHIGEVITTANGQKGVVFYVSPDDGSYWLTAMNDLPSQYSWSPETDIPSLSNYNENDQFVTLHGVHCGYDATQHLREAIGTSSEYASSNVDFDHGWHIPSAGQLSKLYGALPFIENALTENGGTTLSEDYYWTSTECSIDKAWSINFGANLYTEGFLMAQDKQDVHRVRSVWSEPCEVEPPTPTPTLPDNIIESDCYTPLHSFEWGIREEWSSNSGIYCRINPLVGDLDDDGIPEIVCFDMLNCNDYITCAKTINVYDGQSKALKRKIQLADYVWAHGNGPYGLVKLPNRKGLIVTAGYDTKLYAYDITSANPNIPVWVSNESYNTGYLDHSVSLGFADFNGDGHPEIYVRNKIFDAETGVLLATTQGGNNQGDSYSHNSHTNHNKLSCPIAFDICGDTRQELILGNEIYDVVITNRNGTAGNHATLINSITPPNGIIDDGHAQIADFNLDGHPDILISNRDTEDYYGTVSFYIWDVFNNQTSQPIQLATDFTGKSIPLIADFDNDGFVEILMDCSAENSAGLLAYRYNPSSNSFNHLWTLNIDEDSYSNTATLFDFNNDGQNELVVTDNSHLIVYDLGANPPTILSNIDCGEISIMQIPIVADVDDDGSAEIIVTGKANGYMQANTMLKAYTSSTEPWRAARKVWNQYMYHATNVNEDLTIPTSCFNTATVFTGNDGTIRRPYNNFLQQAGYITPTGEPIGAEGEPQMVDLYETLNGQYIWNGVTYTQPGDYTQYFTDIYGCDSIVTLHLTSPIDPNLPDNVLENDCNENAPQPFQGGQLLYQTQSNVNVYSTPLCGDINGDGIVDIVAARYTTFDNYYHRHWSNEIGVYSGHDLSLQSTISIPQEVYLQYEPLGIVRYPKDDGTMQGAIVAVCCDGLLRSYSKDGQLLNTSDYSVPCDGTPSFADFNGDGFPEVYIGNAVFDVATLKRLCAGPSNGNKGLSYRGTPNTDHPHRTYYAIPFAYDVTGDNKMELICGNTIYNVNIVSRTNSSLNSITVNKVITPPSGFPQDGQVAIADLDLDGEIEVLVTKDLTDDCTEDYTYFYAYKPSTEAILFQHQLYCRSTGYFAVCNIDSDPHPEILFIDYQYNTSNEKLYCWRYNGNGLSTVWTIHHNDPSGMTSMVFFDFNLDEIPEIVYRDAYHLNIIDGQNGEILYSYPMYSGTAGEHPIVADVNNDGHAEIIVPGLLEYYSGVNGHGNLLVFGNEDWPNARQVWNQYAYNVTNVNNDLTVPNTVFNNATVFTDDDTIRRPYNNFLQQAGYITPTGEPYNPSGYVEVEHYGEGCETYIFNGTTYTESGDYEQYIENPMGCDTLLTVHVQLGDTIHASQYKSVCTPYTWNGITYDESGIYQQTFTSAQGCDSIVTLYLNVGSQIMTNIAVNICDSYTWNGITYDESGIYEQTFTSYQGCDSIVILDLTVKPSPYVSPIHGESLIYYQENGNYTYSIDPVTDCFGYEWSLDGPWTINSSSDSPDCTVNINSPGVGTLKVRVYSECGFVERTLLINHDARPNVVVYPNPTQGEFNIVLYGMRGETIVVIYDYLGQFIGRFSVDANMAGTTVPYSLAGKAAGVYLLQIFNNHYEISKKVVKATPATYGIYFWDW